MAKKNNSRKGISPNLSQENILRQRGRTWPIKECYAGISDLEESGFGIITVAREHKGGKVSLAIYELDTYCRGLVNTGYSLMMEISDYRDYINRMLERRDTFEKVDYVIAHNWIFNSIEYGAEAGFSPHKSFGITKYMLEDDEDESIPIIDTPNGKDGKHLFVAHSMAEYLRCEPQLKKYLGEGNFDYIIPVPEDEMGEMGEMDEIDEMDLE